MTKHRRLIVPAITLGVLLLALAALYAIDSAGALPGFLPGHEAGSTHHHVKHAVAAAMLAVGAFVFAWLQSGSAPSER